MKRQDLLQEIVRPIDIKALDVVGLVESMSQMAFQATRWCVVWLNSARSSFLGQSEQKC